MKELAVVRLAGDVVMDDQSAVDIDDALHVVRGELGRAAIAHRLGVGFAEDEHLLIAIRQDLLASNETVPSSAQSSDGIRKRLAVLRLVVETLGQRLVHDVEPVQIVADLLLCVRQVARKPICAGDILGTGDRTHLGPVQRDETAADQAGFLAELDKGGARRDNGFWVIVSEGGDRAVVWRQSS